MSRPKGFIVSEETRQKNSLAHRGTKHIISEEGLLQMHLANVRRRGKHIHPMKKPRIEIFCPICGEKILTYITKKGIPGQKYHRNCYLIVLGRNSKKAFLLSQTPQAREKNRVSVLKNYQENPQLIEHLRQKTIEYFQNPFNRENNRKKQILSHNTPEYHLRAREAQLKALREHPERSGNASLRRNRMTSIEKLMSEILWELNIFAVWNAPIRTNMGTKFPDFILIPPIVIQCDGAQWHTDSILDTKWDEALLGVGYNVLRFTGKEIRTFPEEVKKIIISAYRKYLLGQEVYRSYWTSPSLVK